MPKRTANRLPCHLSPSASFGMHIEIRRMIAFHLWANSDVKLEALLVLQLQHERHMSAANAYNRRFSDRVAHWRRRASRHKFLARNFWDIRGVPAGWPQSHAVLPKSTGPVWNIYYKIAKTTKILFSILNISYSLIVWLSPQKFDLSAGDEEDEQRAVARTCLQVLARFLASEDSIQNRYLAIDDEVRNAFEHAIGSDWAMLLKLQCHHLFHILIWQNFWNMFTLFHFCALLRSLN